MNRKTSGFNQSLIFWIDVAMTGSFGAHRDSGSDSVLGAKGSSSVTSSPRVQRQRPSGGFDLIELRNFLFKSRLPVRGICEPSPSRGSPSNRQLCCKPRPRDPGLCAGCPCKGHASQAIVPSFTQCADLLRIPRQFFLISTRRPRPSAKRSAWWVTQQSRAGSRPVRSGPDLVPEPR